MAAPMRILCPGRGGRVNESYIPHIIFFFQFWTVHRSYRRAGCGLDGIRGAVGALPLLLQEVKVRATMF